MASLPPALWFGFAAAAATTLGLVAVSLAGRWSRANAGIFAAFAAGSLICVALLHLTPEALMIAPQAPAFMLAGFAAGYFLNRGVLAFASRGDKRVWAAGLAPVAAIALHSFVDGLAYAITFSVSFATGALTALGLILHEVPEGIIVFTLLQRVGFSGRAAFGVSFLAAAATTPLGAALGHPFVTQLSGEALGALFATTAGLLLYVAAGHLLPHVEREPAIRALPALGVGAAIAIGAVGLHADTHGHHGHDHARHLPAPAWLERLQRVAPDSASGDDEGPPRPADK